MYVNVLPQFYLAFIKHFKVITLFPLASFPGLYHRYLTLSASFLITGNHYDRMLTEHIKASGTICAPPSEPTVL